MALIIHRCTCGHPDFYHRQSGCEMPCGCRTLKRNPDSEVIPTWNGLGQLIAEITKPGERYNHHTTHDCDNCQQLYDDMGAVAA